MFEMNVFENVSPAPHASENWKLENLYELECTKLCSVSQFSSFRSGQVTLRTCMFSVFRSGHIEKQNLFIYLSENLRKY
jgi:hypothetical protein